MVDDGSPDGTAAIVEGIIAQNDRVHILSRPRKMGLGTAYLAGFRWALEREYDIVFEMDADFSHDPGHLPDFLRAIEATRPRAWIAVSRRQGHGRELADSRLILSYFANVYARAVTGLPVWDATGGFKCFRRSVLEVD